MLLAHIYRALMIEGQPQGRKYIYLERLTHDQLMTAVNYIGNGECTLLLNSETLTSQLES